jgi:predicted  nucleic acid-binding Zn-ribbon protein
MDEASFQRKLAELVAEIGTLPAGKGRNDLERTAEQVQQRHAELRTTVAQLQDSIDYVRISLKYLLFDLEATRRENKALRRMLEDGPDGPPPPPGSEPFDIG